MYKFLASVALALAASQSLQADNGSFGVDFVSPYFFRGLAQESSGLIAQPRLKVNLPDTPFFVGVWSSFHGDQTGSDGSGPDSWYESRLSAGIERPLGNGLTGSAAFVNYSSPNGAFEDVQEAVFRVTHDSFLKPYAELAVELDGSRSGPDEGVYLEAGVRPCVRLGEGSLCVAAPASVGLGLHEYYESKAVAFRVSDSVYSEEGPRVREGVSGGESSPLGFVKAGLELEAPVGRWKATAGAHHLWLFEDARALNGGDGSVWVFGCGLSVGF